MSKQQVIDELHKNARKNFPRRKTIVRGILETLQIDLAEMGMHASVNQNYKFILVVIDVFTKFVWTAPLQSKTAKEVSQAMRETLKKIYNNENYSGYKVINIQSDAGKEFLNSNFQDLMKANKINHYITHSPMKSSICERVIRTLKTKLYKRFHLFGSYKWYGNVLNDVVYEYNNSTHRTIKMKPIDVNNRKVEQKLLNTVYKFNIDLSKQHLFNVGDHVRISKYKTIFAKGYLPRWSTEIFTITKIQFTQPVTYLLKDYNKNEIAGAFYEPELQKVKQPDVYLVEKIVKRRGDKVLVKWLGFDESHNTWQNKDKLL